jgi:hypothetical protein
MAENKIDQMYVEMANWEFKNNIKDETIGALLEIGFMEGWKRAIEASEGKNDIKSSEPQLPLGDVSGNEVAVCDCERDYVCGLCYKQKGYKVVDGKLQTDH